MNSTHLAADYLGSKVIKTWTASPGIMVEISVYFHPNATVSQSLVETLIQQEIAK